jgi:curved DNA-binding protein CbpA
VSKCNKKSGAVSLEEIKQVYRELARVWHAGRFTNDARLRQNAQEN